MQVNSDEIYRFDKLRPGQKMAILTIIQKGSDGQEFISIVLPTRYGKSHVIRMSAAELIHRGKACCAIVLSPSVDLVDQLVDEKKIRDMIKLLDPKPEFRKVFRKFAKTMKVVQLHPFANDERFLSLTIQLVQRNLEVFIQLVQSMRRKTGLPVLVYIDEAHLGSTENEWGNVAARLAAAGAICILLTATADRADGNSIHGFRTEILSEEEISRKIYRKGEGVTSGKTKVEEWAGTKRLVRLVADYELTLKEAWEEKPLPIAKVECLPFDINLKDIRRHDADLEEDLDDILNGKDRLLSELKETEARRVLGKVVRDPLVVREGVRILIDKMRELKRGEIYVPALVFSANDQNREQGDDVVFNKHASLIKKWINKFAPEIRVGISTSKSTEDSDEGIRRLKAGEVHILVVKQRASLGLDVEALKIILDLSPVRTVAAWIQRLMRCATVYGRFHGILITPNDTLFQTLWRENIEENGGNMTSTDLEKVKEYEVDSTEDVDKPHFVVSGTSPADFGDSDRNWADAGLMEQVLLFRQVFPHVVEGMSHAALAAKIQQHGIRIERPAAADEETYNTDKDLLEAQEAFDKIMHEITCADRNRRGVGPRSDEDFGTTARAWSNKVYDMTGVPFVRLSKESDITKLQRLIDTAKRVYVAVVNRRL
jgi:superfamily II DNA or RNA helicase